VHERAGHADRQWGNANPNSALFSFTIVSTIGYGNFAPETRGGKWFLVCYAMFGIPVVGTCVGILAGQVLTGLEFIAVMHMNELVLAFEHFDTDNSGFLDLDEFREALEQLKIEDLTLRDGAPSAKFTKLVESIDDGSGQIDLKEFKICASTLNLPIGRAARTRVRMLISIATSLIWLFVGSSAYVWFEDWSYADSFYFSVVTLTTIGLGDFVPGTSAGVTFHYFYCVIGLGLIALLLTAVGEYLSAKHEAMKKLANDLVTEVRLILVMP
jgi:hypothetical protein